jgi:hypothetical protein
MNEDEAQVLIENVVKRSKKAISSKVGKIKVLQDLELAKDQVFFAERQIFLHAERERKAILTEQSEILIIAGKVRIGTKADGLWGQHQVSAARAVIGTPYGSKYIKVIADRVSNGLSPFTNMGRPTRIEGEANQQMSSYVAKEASAAKKLTVKNEKELFDLTEEGKRLMFR